MAKGYRHLARFGARCWSSLVSVFQNDREKNNQRSGRGALDLLRRLQQRNEAVALLLVDHRIPQMTGVETLQQAIKLYPRAKRALLTAYADTLLEKKIKVGEGRRVITLSLTLRFSLVAFPNLTSRKLPRKGHFRRCNFSYLIDTKCVGGRGGIRTPDTLSSTPVFKTGAINHSATLPLHKSSTS